MKKLYTVLLSVTLSAVMIMPALADEVKARVKTVDANAETITLVEGKKDFSFAVTPDTKFLNVRGGELANGIKSADLRVGRHVIADYTTQDGKMVLNSLQLRGKTPHAAAPTAPATPVNPAG